MNPVNQIKLLIVNSIISIWRYRWRGIFTAWVIAVIGWGVVFSLPYEYESKARLYVDADAVLTPLLKGITIDSATMTHVEVLQKTLLSRPNMDILISKVGFLGYPPSGPEHDRLIEKLQKNITISQQSPTLFVLSYKDRNPKRAYDVINNLIDIFIEKANGSDRASLKNAATFLDKQISFYEEKLRAAESRRANFRAKFLDLLPDNFNGGISRLELLRNQIEDEKTSRQSLMAKKEMLDKELASTPRFISVADAINMANRMKEGVGGDDQNPNLTAAQMKLDELKTKFTDEYPEVIAQKQIVDMMKSNATLGLHKERNDFREAQPNYGKNDKNTPKNEVPNPEYTHIRDIIIDTDTAILSQTQNIEATQKEVTRLEQMLQQEPAVQAEWENLDRDYDIIKRNYDGLLDRREQLHIASAADIEADKIRLQIIDPPSYSEVPISPSHKIFLLAVPVIAFIGGGFMSFIGSQIDGTMRGLEDFAAFNIFVLGGVSPPPKKPKEIATGVIYAALATIMIVISTGIMYDYSEKIHSVIDAKMKLADLMKPTGNKDF